MYTPFSCSAVPILKSLFLPLSISIRLIRDQIFKKKYNSIDTEKIKPYTL